ncbi:hypothetical protein ACEPAG_1352 [Sanghuangporus baumii]
MRLPIFPILAAAASLSTVLGGPLAYCACQTACNAGVVTCYAAAGLTFGTVVAAPAAPAAAIACNSVLGVCMAACAASFLAPIP